MVHSIRDLNLHDSELLEIVIKTDEVTMRLSYIEDYETMRCSRRDLIFRGCTEMSLKINGGICSSRFDTGRRRIPIRSWAKGPDRNKYHGKCY